MRPPSKASVFSLDVLVHDVTHEAGCVADSLERDSLAIACRFLDYPLIFIRPRSQQRDRQTIKFNNGKSCALSEVKACLKNSLQQVRPFNPDSWPRLNNTVDYPAPALLKMYICIRRYPCTCCCSTVPGLHIPLCLLLGQHRFS